MCGIAGVLDRHNPVSPETLRRMAQAMAHRGPDGEGIHVGDGVGLAVRRLAILDLSDAAQQPMMAPGGRHILVYNGEIYNFRELRAELEAEGIAFFSTGDTEVVLKALIHWGEAAIPRFNGMFAFALWDSRREILFLARDRFGKKPLYYAFFDNQFIFGSELKAILKHPSSPADST